MLESKLAIQGWSFCAFFLKLAVLNLIMYAQFAHGVDNDVLKNFSDFFAYRTVVNANESAEDIVKEFISDSVQGSILKDRKMNLKDFFSVLDAYSKKHQI
ncbi:MAG: hypothetical protein ACXVCP_02355 [Bdellovibrio sp.]